MPQPRFARVTTLRFGGAALDQALCLWFPGPASATGEDMAEFHLHGGPAVVRSVMTALGRIPGLRLSEPGEFTRRGFLSGKLDLTQAEAIADLVDAETEFQAAQALSQMQGALRALYENWRHRILKGLAYTEAVIDFPDEDVPDTAAHAIAPDLQSVCHDIAQHLADGHRGEILRDGLSVVILGPPNAGKSSLLNALARRDVAIVSEQAGTTRDVLEVRLNLRGYPVIVADTAGLRETQEFVEGEGIRRALDRASSAQIRLLVVDPTSGDRLAALTDHLSPGDLIIWSKADLGSAQRPTAFPSLSLSVENGVGLGDLVDWLSLQAEARTARGSDISLTRARHREALEIARAALDRGLSALDQGLDLAAEDFRIAARAIGRITGRVDVEDLLDVVFRDFCIGK